MALGSKSMELYETALENLVALAKLMGSALTMHLSFLLPPLGSKVAVLKVYLVQSKEDLQRLEKVRWSFEDAHFMA